MSAKKTLLVVEDEVSILQSVQRILELSGDFEVITAANGVDALNHLSSTLPDMIISDIAMPEMDGIELCKKVRQSEATRSIPFIFLTGKRERLLEGIQTGSDDYLVKPFQVDELMAKITGLFRRIESSRDQARLQKGNLSEYDLDDLLQICAENAFSGELVLRKSNEEAIISLDKGEIAKVEFKKYREDQALDVIRQWQEGTFILRSHNLKIKSRKSIFDKSDYILQQGDLSEAVQIARDSWWVGWRNPDTLLQMNVYLRQFKKDNNTINYLIDPGSPIDFPIVSKKVASLIGDISKINVYSINHQDPDVAMNAVFLKNINKKAICLTTEDNWRLAQHYEINPKSVKLIDDFNDWRVRLVTDHELIFIPSPYCHARGAFLTYDVETRVLYTGDLFAGISQNGEVKKLWAEEMDWDGIMAFQQLYMPSGKAIRHAIKLIRSLRPEPLVIAPQHGSIIKGEIITLFIERLYHLDVGADLLDIGEEKTGKKLYLDAINEVLTFAAQLFTRSKVAEILADDPQLQALCQIDGGSVITIFGNGEKVMQRILNALIHTGNSSDIAQIKSIVIKSAVTRNLSAPSMDWDAAHGPDSSSGNIFSE